MPDTNHSGCGSPAFLVSEETLVDPDTEIHETDKRNGRLQRKQKEETLRCIRE